MLYIHRNITYPPYNIGSCSVCAAQGNGYRRAVLIPYTDEELENLDTEKKVGVLYIEVR